MLIAVYRSLSTIFILWAHFMSTDIEPCDCSRCHLILLTYVGKTLQKRPHNILDPHNMRLESLRMFLWSCCEPFGGLGIDGLGRITCDSRHPYLLPSWSDGSHKYEAAAEMTWIWSDWNIWTWFSREIGAGRVLETLCRAVAMIQYRHLRAVS